jgi:hypothetical protein
VGCKIKIGYLSWRRAGTMSLEEEFLAAVKMYTASSGSAKNSSELNKM